MPPLTSGPQDVASSMPPPAPASDGYRITMYTDAAYFGGAEKALGTLLSELDQDLDVVVAGPSITVLDELALLRPGTRVEVIPAIRGKGDLAGFAATVSSIRALDTQILHANLSGPAACQHVLAACALIPSVRTVAVEQLPYALEGRLQPMLKRFTSKRLAAQVAVGYQGARDVEGLFGRPEGSVHTIYNGVADIPLDQLPRISDGPVIGSVGRLDHQKGYDVLLRAMAQVPGAQLVLIGDGAERPALESLAVELGIADQVSFEGHRSDARDMLTTFDVFALPSRFEGLPLAIIDAMLARLPIVTTPVGSIAEAVFDGESGRLVPPDDPEALGAALRELIADKPRCIEMGARARARALDFSPGSMARSYEQLYGEILSQRAPRPKPATPRPAAVEESFAGPR